MDTGYARSDIYNILTLLDNDQSIERKPGSGRPTTPSDKKLQRMLKRKTEGKVAKSLRALGREVGACAKTVKSKREHGHTCQEAAVLSTGLGAAGNDAATAVEQDGQVDFPGESRRGSGDGRLDLSHPGWQRLAGLFVFYLPHEGSWP
ncbi:uncharacterized protein LOC129734095 [Wyeomyia smithii]|uniref:uncharacterized protein LOC129734095 n=1 Tax=Wyeomyia smithii TaxID=174621 RepID=UPI002467DEEF|nr:uncharacterized protein LOC129734095 [Wyeomyia smithii]